MMENFSCLWRVAKIFYYIATPPLVLLCHGKVKVRFGSAKKFREHY